MIVTELVLQVPGTMTSKHVPLETTPKQSILLHTILVPLAYSALYCPNMIHTFYGNQKLTDGTNEDIQQTLEKIDEHLRVLRTFCFSWDMTVFTSTKKTESQ